MRKPFWECKSAWTGLSGTLAQAFLPVFFWRTSAVPQNSTDAVIAAQRVDFSPETDSALVQDRKTQAGKFRMLVANSSQKISRTACVKHYSGEQHQTLGEPVESLRQSYGYLSKVVS